MISHSNYNNGNVVIAEESDKDLWNRYLAGKNNLPPLSNFEWKYILEDVYNTEVLLLMALDEHQQACGVLPVYFIKDYSGKNMIFSLKYGFIIDKHEVGVKLLEYLKEYIKEKDVIYTSLSSGLFSYEIGTKKIINHTVILDLPETEEEMWSKLRAKVRNMIRKGEKDGISVEYGKDKVQEFYRIYTDRMLEKSVRIHSKEFFSAINKYCLDNVQIFIAKKNNEVIGGMYLLHNEHNGIYIYGGSKITKETSPNQLLLWEIVKYCINNGVYSLDLGESIPGSGVHNFKLWFGGRTEEVYNYQFDNISINNLSFFNNNFLFIKKQFLRLSSYIVMRYGTKNMKRRIGVWKRIKGSLQ